MKILVVLPGSLPFPPTLGGAVENLVDHYIQYNEKTKKDTYTVISKYDDSVKGMSYKRTKLLYVDQNNYKFKIKRIIRYLLRRLFGYRICNAYVKECLKLVQKDDYDLIIIENSPEYGVYFKKKFKNAKIILHLHNDAINIERKSSGYYASQYDKILTVSDYIKKRVLEVSENTKIYTLYNAIDLKRFKSSEKKDMRILSKYKISDEKKIVMYVGRIQEEKGVLELIEGFINANHNKNMQLVLVGGPFFKNGIEDDFYKKINKIVNDNKESILMTGFVDYDKIDEIISVADIGVVPSKCNEAFGLSLLEFMACGKPTLVTNDGALTEIADENTSIILNKNDNLSNQITLALEKLFTDGKKYETMKKEAVKIAQKYNINEYLQTFIKYIGG